MDFLHDQAYVKMSQGVGELLFTFAYLSFIYRQHMDGSFEPVPQWLACAPT
jgi:hypothetical protein